MSEEKIKKVSIVCSKGSLEGVYPALIMANGARMEGIEASIFFTFFGLYAILKEYQDKIKIATVGNPAMRVPDAKGMALPTLMGAIPGMSAFATKMMMKEMDALDIPPIGEFIEMIHDAGGKIAGPNYADLTGSAVVGGADINLDGYDDVFVGAPYNDDNQANGGAAYLVLGGGF